MLPMNTSRDAPGDLEVLGETSLLLMRPSALTSTPAHPLDTVVDTGQCHQLVSSGGRCPV